ncbi:alpha/beta-hydrolase [Xylariaceae sp. FL1651]|nr:alpha/beta-hydrolase [Xylariaceae sp. FL1651]
MQILRQVFLALALLPLFAFCSPNTRLADRRGEITAALAAKLDLFSQYAAAIYCVNNGINPRGVAVTCDAGTCPQVEAAQAVVFGNFYNVGMYSTTGMVAVDPLNKHIVLVFRGAEGIGDQSAAVSDLIPCATICAGCRCHDGFYGTWTVVRDQATTLVAAAQEMYPTYSLVVAGHSLGAAQAIFAAAEFRTNGTAAMLYTYGQPQVGDEGLARHITHQGHNYRVTHTDDPAPHLPVNGSSLGYVHNSPEFWIYKDANANFTVAPDQIRVIHGVNSTLGNAGIDLDNVTVGSAISAHVEYFQPQIALCYTSVQPVATTVP